MRTIYKYSFNLEDLTAVELPEGAQVLSVQHQEGSDYRQLQLWAIVDPSRPMRTVHLVVRGTGHPMQGNEGDYLGTVQLLAGRLVFHVFTDLGEQRVGIVENVVQGAARRIMRVNAADA